MTRLPVEQYFCGHCGAKPHTPCRTPTGKVTRYHANRYGRGEHKHGSTHLACWDAGFKAGLAGVSEKRVKRSADIFLSPAAYVEGWKVGSQVVKREYEKARQRYMT